MKRLSLFACVVALFATEVLASPVPDFWYVVPGTAPATTDSKLVRGIVVPSSAKPAVETTPAGSILSWRHPDGTRRSFVVKGVSSITFEPGPLAGTTYVPFRTSKRVQYDPDGCCHCASWQNSEESIESLSCVVGCQGCGCEACICSPTYPCPAGPDGGMTLAADNDPSVTMTFDKSGVQQEVVVVGRLPAAARVRGKNLVAKLSSTGETIFSNPDSIALAGRVTSRKTVRGDKAFFVWTSPEVAVILEQQQSMRAPSFRDGVIGFDSRSTDAPAMEVRHLQVEPVMDRCSACGHHPNSQPDLEVMDCVPGEGACLRCVSWECFAPNS
jgi:hypothetical protein